MNRIKELRKKKGVKQIELCQLLNVTQGNVSAWENGLWEPSNETLKKLADYFDVSTDYLLGRETENTLVNLDDVQIALYEGAKGLTEQGKQDVLKYIDFLKSKENKK